MKRKAVALILILCLFLANVPAALAVQTDYATASTTLFGSANDKLINIEKAIDALDGTAVEYGETFSFNEVIGPRTRERGYVTARNGRGARVVGGGVAQLASTLYLALQEGGYVDILPFETYGDRYKEWYVDNGADAVVTDYAAKKDFRFTSNYDGVIYIHAWMDEDDVFVELSYESGDDNLIGHAATPITGSVNKQMNILRAAQSITGVSLSRFELFSFNDMVGPRTKAAGYVSGMNGRGVEVIGGGVAQVASTIYLAVKELDCVLVNQVRTYGDSYVDSYVADSKDAVLTDYNAGIDFSFNYVGKGILTIELYEQDGQLVCEIYED